MNFTLNQIVKTLENIADRHKLINSFDHGDLWEASKDSIQYPYMFAVQINPVTTTEREVLLKFSLLFMDLVKQGEENTGSGNETEVQSDQLQIALDVRAELMKPSYEDSFRVDFNSNIEMFTERFNDLVSGCKMDLTFRITDLKDRCAIPIE
jgi:hypothetical protein